MTAIPPEERPAHAALIRELFAAVRERRAVPDGFAFRFDAGEFGRVSSFIGAERLCCPFLVFTLTAGPGQSPLWLTMTGPRGTAAFLTAELGLDVDR
jgi:hypothetical protein